MAAEMAIDYGMEPEQYRSPLRLVESENPQGEIERLVHYFDKNWQEEGLPQDWYNLGKVGFSMDSQLALLQGADPESKRIWMDQTEQDIKGFVVEYLKSGLVHPSFYEKTEDGQGAYFKDMRYHKALPDTVSPQERNGVVRQTITQIHDSMLENGGIQIMTSPKGKTGLKTDRGTPIEYPYTFFYMFTGDGKNMQSVGIETDFSLEECRGVIARLTGQILPENASIEEYVRSVAKISPDQGIRTPQDLVEVLRRVRKTDYARDGKKWGEIYQDIGRLDQIHALEQEADASIKELREKVMKGDNSALELRKMLAATILILSKHYIDGKARDKTVHKSVISLDDSRYADLRSMSYGQILEEVEKIPGCAGGGTAVQSITDRLGVATFSVLPEDKYGKREVTCPNCGELVIRPKDTLVKTCGHCGSNKISCK